MKPDTGSPIFEKFLYVFFDFETMQEDVIGEKVVEGVSLGAINRHVVNLCVFQLRCFKWINEDESREDSSEEESRCSNKDCENRVGVLTVDPFEKFCSIFSYNKTQI